MAQIVTITNPLTGQPAQVDQLDHTAQQIDDAIARALPGGNIDTILSLKAPLASPAFTGTPTINGVAVATVQTISSSSSGFNPNLLDNWYFGNPVNQRNVSGTIDTVGYFLDRWKLVSGSVTIGSNGITLNGTIVQILETAVGTDVTASALTTEGVVVASYDSSSKTFSLHGTGQTFVAAKLELGTQQTLAHQENGVWVLNEIPNYGEQLARCQRYFVNFNPYKMAWFAMPPAVAVNTTQAYSAVTLPVAMRAKPVVSYGGNIVLSQSADHAVTNILVSDNTFTGNSIQLGYEVGAGTLTANSLYRVQGYYDPASYIWLSADL